MLRDDERINLHSWVDYFVLSFCFGRRRLSGKVKNKCKRDSQECKFILSSSLINTCIRTKANIFHHKKLNMKNKPTLLLLSLCFMVLNMSAQNYVGAGNSDGISVYSSSEYTAPNWIKTAKAKNMDRRTNGNAYYPYFRKYLDILSHDE